MRKQYDSTSIKKTDKEVLLLNCGLFWKIKDYIIILNYNAKGGASNDTKRAFGNV